jgi:hypothetical protein
LRDDRVMTPITLLAVGAILAPTLGVAAAQAGRLPGQDGQYLRLE